MLISMKEKNKILFDFSESLKLEQNISFASTDLYSKYDIIDYSQHENKKPVGLWLSYGNAWIKYLLQEKQLWANVRIDSIFYIYEIELNEEKILTINNENQFDNFNNKYSIKRGKLIDWERVEEEFDGIKIKYFPDKACDKKYDWYCDWDVSSGCIWNKDGIKEIKKILSFKINFEKE